MKKKFWIFAAFVALAALSRAYGTVVLPYTFSPNTTIPAAGINANDGALRDEINSHEASRNAHQTRLQDVLGLSNSCGAYSIDFNLNQALNMEVEHLSADPSAGNPGRIFVNTTDHNLKFDNGSTIITIAGTGVNTLTSVLNAGNSAGSHNLDMNEQQLLRARAENLSSAPSSGNAGRIYWDTVLQSLYIDTGAAWVAIGGAQGLASVLGVSNSAGSTNIDFNSNQAKNMVLDKLSSDPGSPAEGQLWYNSTSKIPKFYNGTSIKAVGNTNTLAQTVALGNSTGGDVNFGTHQATNLVLFNNNGSPGTGTGGFVWYDTGDSQIHFETSSANHAVCSLDQTQTMTNKMIDGGSNTLTNIGDGSLSANVDLLNGAQTISAKKTFSAAPQISRIKTASGTTNGHVVPTVSDDTFTLNNASQILANKVLSGATMSANLDMAEFEAQHFRVENFLGTPTVGHAGRIYFNTGDGQLHFDDGTNWHTIGVDVPNLASILAIGNSAGSNSIDFNDNQGLNMLLENLSSNPTAGNVGRVYINTVDHHAHLDTGSKTLALTDSLTPNTTKGDVQVSNGTDNVRFPVGSDGQVLSADASQTLGWKWINPLTNPMTTLGDLIIGGAAGAATRFAVGGVGTTLASTGTNWMTSSSPMAIFNTAFTASASTGTLTVALKQADGSTNCSAAAPCIVALHNSSATSTAYALRPVTGALSLALPSASGTSVYPFGWFQNNGLGDQDQSKEFVWVYEIDSDGAGTMKLGVSGTYNDDSLRTGAVAGATTVTISNASPAVVTATAHGYVDGDEVIFDVTGGSMNTGLSQNRIYFVVASSANTFEVALTKGGTPINTSGAGSGTKRVYPVDRIASDAAYANAPVRLVGRMTFSPSDWSSNAWDNPTQVSGVTPSTASPSGAEAGDLLVSGGLGKQWIVDGYTSSSSPRYLQGASSADGLSGIKPVWRAVDLANGVTGTLGVGNGGLGIASGTSGGILGFTASGTIASSGALTANQLIVGGGAGVTPSTLAAGSQFLPLVMGASNPGYAALALNQTAATSGALPTSRGGLGADESSATGAVSIGSGTVSVGTLAHGNGGTDVTSPGAVGQQLTSDGTNFTSTMFKDSKLIRNCGLAVTASAGALTIALKQADGSTDPTSSSPCLIAMRSSTLTTGGYNIRPITAALSLVLTSGTGILNGLTSSQFIYFYAVDSDGAGTMKLAASAWPISDDVATTSTESASVTATSATPAVFTFASNNLLNNDAVMLKGTPPTGFSTGVVYYVVHNATDGAGKFRLAATPGGADIASSSTGTSVVLHMASRMVSDAIYTSEPIRMVGRALIPIVTQGTWVTPTSVSTLETGNNSYPCFVHAHNNNAVSLTNSTTIQITLNSVDTDTCSMMVPSGSGSVAIIPHSGYYRLTAMAQDLEKSLAGGGARILETWLNGAAGIALMRCDSNANVPCNYLQGTKTLFYSQNDLLGIAAIQASGGTVSIGGAGTTAMYMQITEER